MILYDFNCPTCGRFETLAPSGTKSDNCPVCGAVSRRVLTVPRFHLDGTDPAYSTAWDKWARDHERSAAKANAKLREHGSE